MMTNFINLLNQYPKLSEPKVTLSNLDVAHRVFFNWKEKGIINYEHQFTDDDITNNVSRKKIQLNAFEALWILIIKELRTFNIGLNTIAKLKAFLFTKIDFDFIKDIDSEVLKKIASESLSKEQNDFLNAFNPNIHNQVDLLQNMPKSNQIYYTPIGNLVNVILLSGESPSIFIYKKPLESELGFEIFNPDQESKYYNQSGMDYRSHVVQGLTENSVINIPIRPLFEQFFENKFLLKYTKDFNLLTPTELKLLKIVKSGDFEKIIIHKNADDHITIESTSSEQILGFKAQELSKTLGLKEYQRAEVIFRNKKNLIIKSTTKNKIDLGNT